MKAVAKNASRITGSRRHLTQRANGASVGKAISTKASTPLSAEVQEIVRLARKLKGSFASA